MSWTDSSVPWTKMASVNLLVQDYDEDLEVKQMLSWRASKHYTAILIKRIKVLSKEF